MVPQLSEVGQLPGWLQLGGGGAWGQKRFELFLIKKDSSGMVPQVSEAGQFPGWLQVGGVPAARALPERSNRRGACPVPARGPTLAAARGLPPGWSGGKRPGPCRGKRWP
jgi:hypothetical protein